jgi:methylamine dehydrogenase accessory protein MauD
MILWTAINSAAIALVMLALFLTIRQVGLLLTRLGPGGARTSDLGPRVGENILPHTAELQDGAFTQWEPTLYIFATQFCPACAMVREAAQAIARHWTRTARLVMVYDGLPGRANDAALPANFVVTAHGSLREKLDVRAVPYAVMTDAQGIVLGHGLVNNASHIESLLEMQGSAVASPIGIEPVDSAVPGLAEVERERIEA